MPFLFPLLAILIWAANTVVSKAAAGVLDPAAISFYRWVIAALALSPFCLPPLWRRRRDLRPWLGKLLVLWRPMPAKAKAVDEDRMPGPRDVKVLKFSKQGGQRPEIKQLRVLGNQRLTSGGQIKRAKPKQKSIKKRQAD